MQQASYSHQMLGSAPFLPGDSLDYMTDAEFEAYTEAHDQSSNRQVRHPTTQALNPLANAFIPPTRDITPQAVAPQDLTHLPGTNIGDQEGLTTQQALAPSRASRSGNDQLEEDPEK